MNSDPFQPQPHADPQDGVAAIHPVTAEALDEAAHKAAHLADGVAHHDIAAPESHGGASHEAAEAPSAAEIAQDAVAKPLEAMASAATEVAGTVADAARDGVSEVQSRMRDLAARVDDTVARAATEGEARPGATLALYNGKVFEMLQGNIAATTALFSALIQAKTLPEAVAINTDHLRRQLDTMTTQSRELATLAQSLALDAMKPLAGLLGREG